MNRIRKVDNKYQVLINENYKTNPSIELSLGSLLANEYLKDYEVKEFQTMREAMNVAYNLPIIDFEKIYSDCIDVFKYLNKEIQLTLKPLDYNYTPFLLGPKHIKDIVFDRVIEKGRRFSFYNFNDVIAFDISVNYPIELERIIKYLVNNKNLRLIRRIDNDTNIRLVGLTYNNITYEIRLWINELKSLMYWIYKNDKNVNDYLEEILNVKNIIKNKNNQII